MDYQNKSTVTEIRERFDKDVARFSNLETGQQTTIDAPLTLELITDAVKYINPSAVNLLDIGCGAGNYTLKMLSKVPGLNCTLIDLSLPMLNKAKERVGKDTSGNVSIIQSDIRDINLPVNHFDIVLAGAVLHHLRDDNEWEHVFKKIYDSLKSGGSFWISDLVVHDIPELDQLFRNKYGEYLERLGGKDFKQKVFDYIELEDTPRSVNFQMNLMKSAGFKQVELLHKNLCFAAFGAIK
ncbi:class I SAM-dependent methyltransferase [Rubrolithibacter danxiaensis]|uniref:class I SAM-dependent methyltransferase n=1 Tax=Rubrolithibacter danxiaensis TaxID=3390805 RepID=UPI003BF84FBC